MRLFQMAALQKKDKIKRSRYATAKGRVSVSGLGPSFGPLPPLQLLADRADDPEPGILTQKCRPEPHLSPHLY